MRVEDALSRFMSIADEFTYGLLVNVTEANLPVDPRVSLLWEHYVDAETDTWPDRVSSWENLHRVLIKTFPRYNQLLGYIEARNAIVHGLGSLTRKQMKKPQKALGRLTAAQISLIGTRLSLSDNNATGCAEVVRELIDWLDTQAAAV
jgi:hypothetical protein